MGTDAPTPLRPEIADEGTWPAPPTAAVYHGLAGEIVREVAPQTEADPVALLATILAAVGNAIGPGPHYVVSGRQHPLLIYPVLVGPTSMGRKGTSWGTLDGILATADPVWHKAHILGGLSTGEGLINVVRDAVYAKEPVRDPKTKVVLEYQEVLQHEGQDDKRALILEEEFGGVLRVLTRENNILSTIIRQAWDGQSLRTMTKNSPLLATRPHITILGHVTREELMRYLDDTETANGFANRFLWLCVRRSRLLPHGGDLDEGTILGLGQVLEATIGEARELGRLRLDGDASAAWERVYERLTSPEPGLLGALAARGAPYVLRLAALYAALDVAKEIGVPHLDAALGLWEYAEDSIRHVFGPNVGDDRYETTILAALAGGELTKTDISRAFSNHGDSKAITATLQRLQGAGKIVGERRPGASGTRGPEVWRLA